MTISSCLNFGGPAPPGMGLRQGESGSASLQPSRILCVCGGTAAGAQCLHLSERFFVVVVVVVVVVTLPSLVCLLTG